MNDKLRGILRTAWNEPRHFFFWLTILSLCGFAAITAAFVAVDTSLRGPMLVLAFVTLGCILCFLVSLPAFILAWIPPVRRLFTWLLRRRFLVLGCLVTLVALFYAVEDWRGRHAWLNYKRTWEAKGEHFDMASFVPPPVPKDQNFFETPLWTDMHFVETNGMNVWEEADWGSHVVFDIYGPQVSHAPSPGNWARGQGVDLAAWQAYYRGASNEVSATAGMNQAARRAFERRYGLRESQPSQPTNYFPIAKEPQTPAADVLLALSRFETNRQLLIAAAARPQARFWINYDAGYAALLPHLARMKAVSQYLSLHADAALKAGDRATALEDLRLQFRLLESIHNEPILISHLVRIAMLQIGLQPVWEGLADRLWTEADLSVIEGELGKLDFLADYRFAMRGERACCDLWGVDYIRKAGINGWDELFRPSSPSAPAELGNMMGSALFRLVPSGWFDQNKLSLCRLQERYLLPVVDLQQRVVSPALVQQAQAAIDRLRPRPYDMLSRLLLPGVVGCAEKFARAQTSADEARIACALERYRLANGQFPETLGALAPKFIEKLPHDVINGQPLKYRRTDDGQFVLYSVGWNQTDDGGQVVLTKSGNADMNKGDWVWRYPEK
jgi:hypothetical protein